MLELNTDNKIVFVVERMKANLLLSMLQSIASTFIFSAGLNEFDLIKLKLPSKAELKAIAEGNKKLYNERIEDILSCKVCNFYDTPSTSGVPDSRPFKYTHFFHPLCVTAWKVHGLNITKCEGD